MEEENEPYKEPESLVVAGLGLGCIFLEHENGI
jgi:hypothetical protein